MNGLRRVLLALYSLLFVAACGGLVVLAWNQDQQLDLNPGGFRLVASISADNAEKWIFTLLMACLVMFGLLTFLLSVSPASSGGRRGGTLRMKQADGGSVEVTSDAIESLLRDELEHLPEIRQADPRVKLAGGGAVDTAITAVIEPSASIAHVTNLIAVTTTTTLREQVGVTNVRRPSVRIQYDEMSARPISTRARIPRYETVPGPPPVQQAEPWPEPPSELTAPVRPSDPTPDGEPWPEPPADLRSQHDATTAPVAPGDQPHHEDDTTNRD